MQNYRNQYAARRTLYAKFAFCLIEVVAALTILVFITLSLMVVYDHCMAAAADSTLRMNAFEVARDNMEELLAQESVELKVENGQSEKYPDIIWQITVDGFYEPVTSRMWLQATCTAQYVDSAGQEKTIELKHWLTDLTEEEVLNLFDANDPNKAVEQGFPQQLLNF
jgi:hypothetical protein